MRSGGWSLVRRLRGGLHTEVWNRQWRWWFPRGMDLGSVSEADVIHAASIINGQRRRSLNYQSPAALYAAAAVQ